MSNRSQRRAAMRSQIKESDRLLKEYERKKNIASIIKNGILPADLRAEYERGRNESRVEITQYILTKCYASVVLVLAEDFGFDDDQCLKAVKAVDQRIQYAIDHEEIADEVLKRIGLKMDFDDPFEPVQHE